MGNNTVKQVECAIAEADDETTFTVALDELERFIEDGVLHMDYENDPEYRELGRFENYNLRILEILVEDAMEAFISWLILKRGANEHEKNGHKCTDEFDKNLVSAIRERDICLRAIREIIEEPSTRILRGFGITYNRILEYIQDTSKKMTDLVSSPSFLNITPYTN